MGVLLAPDWPGSSYCIGGMVQTEDGLSQREIVSETFRGVLKIDFVVIQFNFVDG